MKIGVAGLGLIGGSIALRLLDRHDVTGFDTSKDARLAAGRAGIPTVDRLRDLVPADAVVIATSIGAIVPTLEELEPFAGKAVLIEVGSLKSAVAAFAERATRDLRLVGLHPMAGSTGTGIRAGHPAMFEGRAFLLVPTARTDEHAHEVAVTLTQELGGTVTECSVEVHDRVVAAVSALPLAAAIALASVARGASPLPVEDVAGPGLRDATRLAGTDAQLALALLAVPGLREHLSSLRSAIAQIESALGDPQALRALLEEADVDRPQDPTR